MKICSKCGITKPYSDFHLKKISKDGRRAECKICHNQMGQEYRDRNRLKMREYSRVKARLNKTRTRQYHLKRTYGLSPEQYEGLLQRQHYQCAVCKRHQDSFTKRLSVDHDHKTLEIYGLLCDFCNWQIIGRHRRPELFQHAADYLKEGTGLFVPENRPKRRRKRRRS